MKELQKLYKMIKEHSFLIYLKRIVHSVNPTQTFKIYESSKIYQETFLYQKKDLLTKMNANYNLLLTKMTANYNLHFEPYFSILVLLQTMFITDKINKIFWTTHLAQGFK